MAKRGRPKKATTTEPMADEPGADQAAENPRAVAGNNTLTDDQRKVIFFQHKRRCRELKTALDTANSRLKLAYKAAKADLGDDAPKDIRFALSVDTPEGEAAAKSEMERRAKILVWMGTAAQLDLFGDVDLSPEVDRARAAGKLAGMDGEACKPPFDHSVPQHDAWMDGWREGQDLLLANGIKPLDEPTTTLLTAEEMATRDAARLAEHDAESDVEHETVDEAQDRLRQGAAMDAGLAGLVREQAATLPADDGLDIPESLRRVN